MKYVYCIMLAALIACNDSDKQAKNGNSATNDSLSKVALNDSSSYTSIQWIDSINSDLGKLTEGQVVEVSWRFRNTGNKPLMVQNVQAGCGCTVAERPSAPIAPGEEGRIKAKFDSKGQGPRFHKTVTVTANTQGMQSHQLTFTGEVNK